MSGHALKTLPRETDLSTAPTVCGEDCLDKATGAVIGHSPVTPQEAIVPMIEAARKAQKEWEQTPVKERAAVIKQLSRHITRHCHDLAETISRDNGKTKVDAMLAEVLPSAMAAVYYAKNAKNFLKDRVMLASTPVLANKVSRIVRVPFGVVGIISPWNYPFCIPFSEVIMALLAGNAVVLKTASETQMVGLALKETMDAAGLPANLFQYVNMKGRLAGDAFLDGGVDKLFFTGSVPVGKYLMAKAAETLIPVSLELGGNDAMIVCADADLDRASAGAVWAGFQNAGQTCGGVERIYVHADVYDGFLVRLKAKTEALRVGYGCSFDTDIGVMTTEHQCRTVEAHIQEALEMGAKIFAQAPCCVDSAVCNSLAPMVLTEVTHDMRVMKEETFGPVVGVMKVDSIEEAVALANDSDLGLTGSVWSKNRKAAEKIARRVRAGAVLINDHLMSHGLPEAPWGGFKASGIGRTHGALGFQEMTEPQVIVTDLWPQKKNLWWHPHDKRMYDGIAGILHALYGDGIGVRAQGLFNMMRIVPRMFRK